MNRGITTTVGGTDYYQRTEWHEPEPVYSANVYRLTHHSMRLERRPCVGGECDDEQRCPRHERIPAVATRYERLLARRRRRAGIARDMAAGLRAVSR